jgi:hypothetical protein
MEKLVEFYLIEIPRLELLKTPALKEALQKKGKASEINHAFKLGEDEYYNYPMSLFSQVDVEAGDPLVEEIQQMVSRDRLNAQNNLDKLKKQFDYPLNLFVMRSDGYYLRNLGGQSFYLNREHLRMQVSKILWKVINKELFTKLKEYVKNKEQYTGTLNYLKSFAGYESKKFCSFEKFLRRYSLGELNHLLESKISTEKDLTSRKLFEFFCEECSDGIKYFDHDALFQKLENILSNFIIKFNEYLATKSSENFFVDINDEKTSHSFIFDVYHSVNYESDYYKSFEKDIEEIMQEIYGLCIITINLDQKFLNLFVDDIRKLKEDFPQMVFKIPCQSHFNPGIHAIDFPTRMIE